MSLYKLFFAVRYPQRCAQLCQKYGVNFNRAIDIGCAVGGGVFELSKYYNSVLGIDLSKAFIENANKMKNNGSITFSIGDSGTLKSGPFEAKLENGIKPENCTFMWGDVGNLPPIEELGGKFDAILLTNTLCRLEDPKGCLWSPQFVALVSF